MVSPIRVILRLAVFVVLVRLLLGFSMLHAVEGAGEDSSGFMRPALAPL